ncbi:MAG: hypothetical protein QNJ46_19915 [Leptolyngbyaceae cyanobacterium MO_188.B28]|nr:hypothetical protein [Leptolyngbyaceae cyanobacterium MO_188.B28]
MDRIQAQAAKLVRLLFSSDTAAIYQKTLTRTWDILKESAILLWLIFCLIFVLADWLWKSSIQLLANLKAWYSGIEDTSANTLLSATGKAIVSAGEASVGYVLSQARDQLGIEAPPKPAKQSTAKPTESSKPAVSPAKSPSADSPAPAATQKPNLSSDNADTE